MTPAMQAARDRVVEAARRAVIHGINDAVLPTMVRALLALEAQEKEQADAEG